MQPVDFGVCILKILIIVSVLVSLSFFYQSKVRAEAFLLILGKFSLVSLVIKLASGMGLLTLTATVVDTLALYVLPDRFRYRSYVYETSPIHEKQLKLE